MLAFILAFLAVVIGVVGMFIGMAIYMSYPAPSVQGDASAPGCWLFSWLIIAALLFASHWILPLLPSW